MVKIDEKSKRVTTYVDKDNYRLFKSKLALVNKSVSGWFREQIDLFINEQKE